MGDVPVSFPTYTAYVEVSGQISFCSVFFPVEGMPNHDIGVTNVAFYGLHISEPSKGEVLGLPVWRLNSP